MVYYDTNTLPGFQGFFCAIPLELAIAFGKNVKATSIGFSSLARGTQLLSTDFAPRFRNLFYPEWG
jgi:hypothetical protein